MCYNWLTSASVHILGQVLILSYAFTYYEVNTGNKMYYIGLICLVCGAYAFYFYCSEHAIRSGALQYARKNAETESWKAMMNKLPEGILINQSGKIVYTNMSANSFFDLAPDLLPEVRTTNVMKAFKGISANDKSLWDLLESGAKLGSSDVKSEYYQFKTLEGSTKRIKAQIWTTNFDSKESVVCTIEDITSSFELEKQIMAKKFEKMLIASFSHELITPINGILGAVELASCSSSLDEVKELTDTAKTACKQLLYLTKDIIEVSEEDKDTDSRSAKDWFEVNNPIKECQQLFAFGFKQKQIAFLVDIGSEVPTKIYTDRIRYRQILIHLVGNALKYTMRGSVSIKLSYSKGENVLVTHVIDTGVGIRTENIENLFRMFGELGQKCEFNPQGMGLGLTICKRHAQALGGTISINSELGIGTTFTLSIPIQTELAGILLNS